MCLREALGKLVLNTNFGVGPTRGKPGSSSLWASVATLVKGRKKSDLTVTLLKVRVGRVSGSEHATLLPVCPHRSMPH